MSRHRLLRLRLPALLVLAIFFLALPASAGLRFTPVAAPEGADTASLASDGTTLWAGTLRGVWKLQGGFWNLDGLPDKSVTSIAIFGGSVWAATGDALYRRGADGTWTAESLPGSPGIVSVVTADASNLYVGGAGVFARSGSTWTALTPVGSVAGMAIYQGDLLVGIQNGGIVRYPLGTGMPISMSAGLGYPDEGGQAFAVYGGLLYTGTNRGVYAWTGIAWNFETGYGNYNVWALSSASGFLWAASVDIGVSRKSGVTWSAANDGLLIASAKSFALLGSDLYVGTAGAPVYRFVGSSWTLAGTGLLGALVSDAAGTTSGFPSPPLTAVATRGAGVANISPSPASAFDVPAGCGDVRALAGLGASQYLAATSCGPYLLGGGSPATAAGSGLTPGALPTSLSGVLGDGTLLAGTTNAGIWRYTPSGSPSAGGSWAPENGGLSTSASIYTVRQVGNDLFSGPDSGIVRFATDGTWHAESSGLPFDPYYGTYARVLALGGPGSPSGPVYAGLISGGIFRRDAGSTFWRSDSKGIGNGSVYSIDLSSSYGAYGSVFAAAGTAAVFRKQAGTWLPESFGLPIGADVRVVYAGFDGNYMPPQPVVFAGTNGQGLYEASSVSTMKTIPVVLDVVGAGGAPFKTELLIGNRSTYSLGVTLSFSAAPGYGAPAWGRASVTIPPGAEIRAADALAYLRDLGIPVPASGPGAPVAGSLTVSAVATTDALYGGARSFTNGPSGGTYGVFLDATSDLDAAEESAWVYGLRSLSGTSRSNLAVTALPGRGTDPITLEVQLYSASGVAAPIVLTHTFAPGDWYQWNGVLAEAGLPDGTYAYARIRRLSGSAAWIAYGVVNDDVTSDGSILPMFRPGGVSAARTLIVPVVVDLIGQQSSHFTTELTLVNDGPIGTPVDLTYRPAPGFGSAGGVPVVSVSVAARQQITIPNVLQYLRDHGVTIPDAATGQQAGTLTISFRNLTLFTTPRTLALARTSTPGTSGGSYGVFYPAISTGGGSRTPAVVTGLVQNAGARSNLAIVHTGGGSGAPVTLQVNLYDATTGLALGTPLTWTLNAGDWYQWSSVFQKAGLPTGTSAAAYAVVTRTSGDDTFLAYGVLNDAVTSDGSYVAMRPDAWY
ncbi:MAG: hypothetical protein ACHQPI_09830 [Thermoanaerobaculia bacterium]